MTQIKSKHQGVKYLLFFYSIYSCDHCDHKATQNESSTETLQIKTDGVFRDDHVSVQMWSFKSGNCLKVLNPVQGLWQVKR